MVCICEREVKKRFPFELSIDKMKEDLFNINNLCIVETQITIADTKLLYLL